MKVISLVSWIIFVVSSLFGHVYGDEISAFEVYATVLGKPRSVPTPNTYKKITGDFSNHDKSGDVALAVLLGPNSFWRVIVYLCSQSESLSKALKIPKHFAGTVFELTQAIESFCSLVTQDYSSEGSTQGSDMASGIGRRKKRTSYYPSLPELCQKDRSYKEFIDLSEKCFVAILEFLSKYLENEKIFLVTKDGTDKTALYDISDRPSNIKTLEDLIYEQGTRLTVYRDETRDNCSYYYALGHVYGDEISGFEAYATVLGEPRSVPSSSNNMEITGDFIYRDESGDLTLSYVPSQDSLWRVIVYLCSQSDSLSEALSISKPYGGTSYELKRSIRFFCDLVSLIHSSADSTKLSEEVPPDETPYRLCIDQKRARAFMRISNKYPLEIMTFLSRYLKSGTFYLVAKYETKLTSLYEISDGVAKEKKVEDVTDKKDQRLTVYEDRTYDIWSHYCAVKKDNSSGFFAKISGWWH